MSDPGVFDINGPAPTDQIECHEIACWALKCFSWACGGLGPARTCSSLLPLLQDIPQTLTETESWTERLRQRPKAVTLESEEIPEEKPKPSVKSRKAKLKEATETADG